MAGDWTRRRSQSPSLCWTLARAGHTLWRHRQPSQGWEHVGRGSNARGEQEPL